MANAHTPFGLRRKRQGRVNWMGMRATRIGGAPGRGSRSKRIPCLSGTGRRTHPRLPGLHAAANCSLVLSPRLAQGASPIKRPTDPQRDYTEARDQSHPDDEIRTLRSFATELATVCRHGRHAIANGRGQAPAVCAACRFLAPLQGVALPQNEAPKVTANARGSSTE